MRVTGDQILPAMFYMAPTATGAPWDQFEGLLKSAQPIELRERCELLLRAVNGEPIRVKDWARLVGAPISVEVPGHIGIELWSEARPALKASLQRVVEDPVTAISDISANAAKIINGEVVIFPEFAVVAGKWIKRERVVASSIGPALIHALSLFLDPSLEFGRLLRRCRDEECGRFQIGSAPSGAGQPANFYCDDEHRKRDKRARSRERVAAMRANMSVSAWRRKHKS